MVAMSDQLVAARNPLSIFKRFSLCMMDTLSIIYLNDEQFLDLLEARLSSATGGGPCA